MRQDKEVQLKPKLTPYQIDYCLIHMLLVPELFTYAKQHLKPADFSQTTELCYALIWDIVLSLASKNEGKLPDKLDTVLQMEIGSRLGTDSRGRISKRDETLILGLYEQIITFDKTRLDPDFYRKLIQDLIIERTVISQMGRDLNTYNEIGNPVDIISSLKSYHDRLETVMANPSAAGQTAFPSNYKPKKLGKVNTNIPWLDAYMNGGQAPGEVYVLLGPSGLGKTTMGINITVETARVWNLAHKEGKAPRKKISCFFSWEQDIERLRHRFWSYAAQIDSSRIEEYADERVVLSTRGNLAEYELEIFKDIIACKGLGEIDGETERLNMITEELRDVTRIFDFSGAADNPHCGEGGLDEVATALKGLEKEGYEIGVVVLDYASVAVRRYLAARDMDMANQRVLLSNWCNDCRFKIAIPFNCPVWALNQMNTEANRRAPTAEQHHSYASECGNFAENAWFAFVFGTKDKVNNTCQLFCTKERRAKGDQPAIRLKIVGNLCTMIDVSQTHEIDNDIKQIIPKSMLNRRCGNNVQTKTPKNRPGNSNLSNF